MVKTIHIGEKPVEINSSAGWLYTYSEQFGHDILVVLMPAIEASLSLIAKVFKDSDWENGDDVNKLLEGIDEAAISEALITLSSMQLTTLTNIVWALARNADQKIPEPKTWLNSFEEFPIDEIMPKVIMAVIESSLSKKNYQKIQNAMKSLSLSPSHSNESPSQESTED